jgi:hypothetical protein
MPPNPQNLKPFVKGDPRIWRGGRPKSFPALQELAQQIAHETAKAGGSDVVIDGHKVTVTEAVLRQWFQSKDFQKQRAAMEIAFGKVPQALEVSGPRQGPIVVRWDETSDTD